MTEHDGPHIAKQISDEWVECTLCGAIGHIEKAEFPSGHKIALLPDLFDPELRGILPPPDQF